MLVVSGRHDEETDRGRTKARELAELLQCGFIEREGKVADVVIGVAQELAVQHIVVGKQPIPACAVACDAGSWTG